MIQFIEFNRSQTNGDSRISVRLDAIDTIYVKGTTTNLLLSSGVVYELYESYQTVIEKLKSLLEK